MESGSRSTIAGLLESNAHLYDGSPALLDTRGGAWSHAALHRSSCAISQALIGLGAQPGGTVAVSLPEGVALARALLGSASRHAALTVGIDLPLPELRALVGSLRPAALVVSEGRACALRELAHETGGPLLEISDSEESVDERGAAPPERRVDDPALVLHTSGTTGRPKPVTLSHANLVHAVSWVGRSLALGPEDRCLNLMPLVHSHGLIGALLSSLAAGGSVVCTERPDPRALLKWASERACTWTTASPTILRLLLSARGTWPGLRFLRSASAPMPPELADALEKRFRVPQIQVYGLTEAYQVSANPLPPGERRPGSVGLPTGCEVAVLGEAGSALDPGEQGEIALRGPNVFRGYGAPGEEPEREAFHGAWFRTGDLGTLDEDGYLRVTGRLGERINRGGEKIAPRAVEAVLAEHPGVEEVLCFPVPDEALGEEIGALVRASTGGPPGAEELRRFAATRLAPTRVPRFFWFRDELPRPASGKINRRELAGTLGLRAGGRGAHDAGAGAGTRNALREIWQEQLDLERAPRDEERFFDLGGTSLGLVELVVTIERRFGVSLPLSAILEAPTLAELAALIGEGPPEALVSEIVVQREGYALRLLPIQPRGEAAPILFVAPAGGSVLSYYALADALPRTRPFWGLQIDLQKRRLRSPFTIPELGEAFVEGIARLSPRGPVILGGWSFGALVAWEIAARLVAQRRPVDRVMALDSWALRYGPEGHDEGLGHALVNIVRLIRESRPLVRDALYVRLARASIDETREGARRRPLARFLMARAARGAQVASLIEKDPRLAALRTSGLSIVGNLRHYLLAARRYEPPRLALPVDVLKAEGSSEASETLGWDHLSRGHARGHHVPGDHFTLLTRPHVEGLAQVMSSLVESER